VGKRPDNMLLTDQGLEIPRPPLPGEHQMAHN
jgi:hypothetical protein